MSGHQEINKQHCTDKLGVAYAHVGLYDVKARKAWIAKKKWGVVPLRVSHAKLLIGGTQDTSTVTKDQYLCYWFNTPNTGEGLVHGYPIEWDEGHLMVRIDPNWNYLTGRFIPNTDTAKIEKNIDQQHAWGQHIYKSYLELKPKFPLSWHVIGPRAADSMFYIERTEP